MNSFPAPTILSQIVPSGVNIWISFLVCSFSSKLLHSINSVLWHKPFRTTFFSQDHVLSSFLKLCFSCQCRALCWETTVFQCVAHCAFCKDRLCGGNDIITMHFICPSLHVQCIFLSRCSLSYSLDAEHRKQCNYINCFALGIALVHTVKKRQVTKQVLRVWWKGMQVVLSEHLSSSYNQWAHLEPSFLLQKKRIHDTVFLGVPHAARGPNAHLPCSRVVIEACCVLVWPGLSPCGTALGLKGTASRLAFPLARCFWWAEMAVLLLAPAWTPWVLSQKSLHHVPGRGTDMPPVSLSRLAGLPACTNLEVGVSGWYFAERCSLILCY